MRYDLRRGALSSLEAFSFFYPILFLAFAVTTARESSASEEENSTFDLLLSTPIRRWRVVLEKYAALVVFTLIVLVRAYLGFWFGAMVAGVDDFPGGDILLGTMNMFPLILFFAALALAMSPGFAAGADWRSAACWGWQRSPIWSIPCPRSPMCQRCWSNSRPGTTTTARTY